MNFETKVIVAISLVLAGTISGFYKIRQYRNDLRRAVTEDLMDLIFFLPQLIFSAILLLVGAGWLYFLLTYG
jgi:ABC-type sulfate transport system permease component